MCASASSVKLSSERPPRSRNHASSPSTSATSAPALRPGRCVTSSSATSRPRQRGAVRVGGIGGGQHHRVVLAALRVDTVEVGPQPVDGRGHRELGAAQRLDEVAALTPAGVLERGQHLVEHREPARHALGRDRALGQHAVAVEQQLGLEVRPHSGVRLGGGQRRPSAGHGRVGGCGSARARRCSGSAAAAVAVAGVPVPAAPGRPRGARRASPAPARTCRR